MKIDDTIKGILNSAHKCTNAELLDLNMQVLTILFKRFNVNNHQWDFNIFDKKQIELLESVDTNILIRLTAINNGELLRRELKIDVNLTEMTKMFKDEDDNNGINR